MKKFKRLVFAVLCACFTLMFAACTVKSGGNGHVHSWGEWQYTHTEHWRECQNCNEEQRAQHSMENGVCNVCGYNGHVHEWSAWEYSETEHWRECRSCEGKQRASHSLKNGRCDICDYVINSIPGLIFSDDGTGKGWAVASDKDNEQSSVTVPKSYFEKPVTTVKSGGFRNNKTLLSINLPSSLIKIGSSAFAGCTSLSRISIPNSVEVIEGLAFSGCSELSALQLNAGLKVIEHNAFEDCGLTSVKIPQGVTTIGKSAFYGCKNLSDVEFPSTLTSVVGDCLFDTAYYNESGNWQNDVLYVGEYCLFVKKRAGSAPSSINVKAGTVLIADSVFNNSDIKNVTLPSGLKYIGEMAFNSAGISSINLPSSLIKIGSSAFAGCKDLTSITGGGSHYTVRNNCVIEKSTGILAAVCKDCIIPDDGSVKSIGRGAFVSMKITAVILPVSVTVIEDGAFGFEPFGGLSKIYYLGNETQFENITVGEDNASFTGATKYYYSASEPPKTADQTAYDGNWWKYGEGDSPEIWKLA